MNCVAEPAAPWTSSPTNMTAASPTLAAPSATSPTKPRKMPSSSLPKVGELSHEDDWTRVKDPKEKKRIQNRVAQRTYRHRMKARLGELQARLDSHEGRRQSIATAPSPERSNSISSMNGAVSAPFGHSTCAPGTMDESPSPMTLSNADMKPAPGQMSLMQAGLYDQPVDDSDPSLFPHAGRLMNSPPYSQSSPTQAHGLLSPPGVPGSEHGNNGKMSGDFMMDCLRFQTQLLNRLNNLEQDPNLPPQYAPEEVAALMEQMRQQGGHPQGLAGFTTAQAEGMEQFFEPQAEQWAVNKMHVNSGPSPLTTPMHPGASMQAAMMEGVSQQQMGKPHGMEARMESVMHAAHAAGFESFDDLATAYYTSDEFSASSRLANEQRLSRNRRLPRFVADVGHASDSWSEWERRGLSEEVLKRAESMVVAEGSAARANVMSKIGPMIEAQDGLNNAAGNEALLAMKKSVQEELPNSWALTMALAADSKMSWQRDRSNTALATVLLLNFSGRIPNDQLLRLIGTCL